MENKFTSIKDRVVAIAESQDISKEEFFKSIGMTSASFRGKAKGTPLNSNAIVNIITKYPEVDLYWLLNGVAKDRNSDKVGIVEEQENKYQIACASCLEKDTVIKILQQQILDLKSDKEDLKSLLGLKK
ncbi:MAG: hypothetical protein HWD85_05730 [Flavobacteriaceae bacterium]|nr:hypothetical protein [Flavobacteriaceae bacterium]